MKTRIRLIFLIAVAVAIGYAGVLLLLNKSARDHKTIKVSGNIEGDDVRISFRVQGQIEQLLFDEGMVIRAGDIVAKLNKDELSKQKAEAEAELKLAEASYELAKIDYVRAENLFQAGAISAQKRDDAKTTMDTDKANVDAKRASLELANTRFGFTDLASPLNGYILTKSSLEGEVVQIAEPVFTAIDLNDIWLTAYIEETDLGKVKLNQSAYVMTDTYRGKKYRGWISFISQQAEFTPKYIQTNEERVKYVYRIKIRVDNASLDLKPGMPADGYIILS